MKRILVILFAGLVLVGCGQRLSGTYVPSGKAPKGLGFVFDKFEFGSGDTIDISAFGVMQRGTYKVDGKKVIITVAGQSTVMPLDDKGCVDGGDLIGKYCKK